MPEPKPRIYLDFNATAPLRPEARAAMLERLGAVGNASSVHREGRAARAAVEGARASVAALAGTAPEFVTFTSGATEGAALALSPALCRDGQEAQAATLILGATEHAAVRQGHRFPPDDVAVLPVRPSGLVDLDALAQLLARPGRAVVALQAANGETGVVQPVAAVARMVRAAGGLLVCDAVQAAGRMDVSMAALGADALILSAHKLGGPQGVGAVAVAPGVRLGPPLLRGGGQERGARAGTENVAAVAGFGAAARASKALEGVARQAALRDRLEAGLRCLAGDLVVFGAGAPRLPNTSAFAVPGLPNDAALIGLDLAGYAVSTGSACSSGKVSRSSVLEAMAVDPHICDGLIRVSLGPSTTAAEVDGFIEAFEGLLRRMRPSPARTAA